MTKAARKNYYAYRRIKNFACVEIHPQTRELLICLKTDPKTLSLQPSFTRDMSATGHFGTGDLEVCISSHDHFERAQPLINAG